MLKIKKYYIETKNAFDHLISKLDMDKESISEQDNTYIETTKTKTTEKKKRLEKQNIQDLWGEIKNKSNI